MRRSKLAAGDLAAIAVGGVLGAAARWGVLSIYSEDPSAGWFAYSRNATFTVGSDAGGSGQSESELPITVVTGIPWDTLGVNLAGCLFLGALTLLLARSTEGSQRVLVAAATGFCGSLTTFSTFAVEVATRLRARPSLSGENAVLNIRIERDIPSLVVYLGLSVAGAAVAFWLGRFVANRIVRSDGDVTLRGAT